MAWGVHTGEFGMLNLQLKQSAVKCRLKWWNRHVFGNLFFKVQAASDAMVRAEAAYLADPSSILLMELNRSRAEYILRTRIQEDFLRQKYVVRWVVEGECNTRFFQSLVKQKRVRTRIHSIHADGRTISDENELRASDTSFFQHHLSNDMIFYADICRDHFSVLHPSSGSLPFVYLGIPLYKGARRKALFALLCDRMRSMVQRWSHRHLSHGGRLALIRSTLATLPLYYLQVLQSTAEIFHELEQIMARFFWDSRDDQRKCHWFVWHDMCVSVDEGGIGIRRLWDMFVAYSMNMYWRFQLQSSLTEILFCCFSGSTERLIEFGLVAHSHIFWSVGSGDQCCLWFDTWFGDRPLVEIMDFPSPPAWSPVGRLYIRDGQWDLLSVRYMVQDCGYSEELVQDIVSVPLRSLGGDVMRWKLTSHGKFSLTSAWESVRVRETRRDLYGAIWSNYLFPTTSFFLRRLLTGHIPVDTRLYSWGTAIPSKCHYCIDFPQVETVTHLFLLNPVVRSVWLHFASWFHCALPHTTDIARFLAYWKHLVPHAHTAHICFLIPCLIFWFTWTERNSHKYRGIPFRASHIIWQVIYHLHSLVLTRKLLPIHWHGCTPSVDFMPVGTPSVPRPVRTIIVRWLLPSDPWIKLNTDGSYDQHTGVASGGGLFRDHLGALLLAFHMPLVVTSSFDAELQALLHGLHLVRRFDAPVWIELDSLVVVHLLQTDHPGPWQVQHTLVHIRTLMTQFRTRVTHIFQEGNRPADYIARRGSTSSALHLLTPQTVPRFFMTLVRMDHIGYPSFRER
ncbi:hypothetical protein ACS0TY_019108 [Phlomoides rotata]